MQINFNCSIVTSILVIFYGLTGIFISCIKILLKIQSSQMEPRILLTYNTGLIFTSVCFDSHFYLLMKGTRIYPLTWSDAQDYSMRFFTTKLYASFEYFAVYDRYCFRYRCWCLATLYSSHCVRLWQIGPWVSYYCHLYWCYCGQRKGPRTCYLYTWYQC